MSTYPANGRDSMRNAGRRVKGSACARVAGPARTTTLSERLSYVRRQTWDCGFALVA
jgi:hypothetical protein